MTFEIGVVAQFEAAHRLRGDFGPASRLHGHTYRLEVTLRGEELAPDGTLYDLGKLRPAVDAIAARLNYRDLDEVDGLADLNTTAEVVARYCWQQIAAGIDLQGGHLAVRIWESPHAWAACDGTLGS